MDELTQNIMVGYPTAAVTAQWRGYRTFVDEAAIYGCGVA